MGNRRQTEDGVQRVRKRDQEPLRLPTATASYRRRAWVQFQQALDPLAPIKPLPRQRP